MEGMIYIILGAACITGGAVSLVLALTWIRNKKKELRKQWEI